MDRDALKRLLGRLRVIPLPGNNGPYSEAVLSAAEERFGAKISGAHRLMLTTVGGTLGIDTGFADVAGAEPLCVRSFFGLGADDYDSRDLASGYAGQVPRSWIPVADDDKGCLYCVAPSGTVHYVELEERYWSRPECPEVPPPKSRVVAASMEAFLALLQLPTWARKD